MNQLCHAKLILELMNSTSVSSFNERAHMKIFTSLRRYIFKLILSSKATRKWFAEWNIWPMIQIWTCFIFQRIILRMREFSSLRERLNFCNAKKLILLCVKRWIRQQLRRMRAASQNRALNPPRNNSRMHPSAAGSHSFLWVRVGEEGKDIRHPGTMGT